DAEGQALIRKALDLGINYIDTADAYGNGRGETILAPIVKAHPDVIIGTKFGYDFYNNPERPRGQRELPQDMSPKFIRFALEQSLKRLGTDHVAIYQPHNPRVDVLMQDEHWDTLEALKKEGKILSYGPSLGPAIGCRAWKVDPGPQFLIRVTHSSGMLEGKYTIDTKFDESDHRSHRPRAWLVEGLQKVDRLEVMRRQRGVTIGQLALLWLYAHPCI